MSNVTAIRTESANLFVGVSEQQIIDRAITILEARHAPGSEPLKSPDLIRKHLRLRMAKLSREEFGCLFLDSRHRLIEMRELFRGTIDGAAVYPREVVKASLAVNAAAVVLYHNHPSGISEPSQSDISLTRRLKEALGLVDVRVLDHFVVSGTESTSLAERGLI